MTKKISIDASNEILKSNIIEIIKETKNNLEEYSEKVTNEITNFVSRNIGYPIKIKRYCFFRNKTKPLTIKLIEEFINSSYRRRFKLKNENLFKLDIYIQPHLKECNKLLYYYNSITTDIVKMDYSEFSKLIGTRNWAKEMNSEETFTKIKFDLIDLLIPKVFDFTLRDSIYG